MRPIQFLMLLVVVAGCAPVIGREGALNPDGTVKEAGGATAAADPKVKCVKEMHTGSHIVTDRCFSDEKTNRAEQDYNRQRLIDTPMLPRR